jgi:hypothetical protein
MTPRVVPAALFRPLLRFYGALVGAGLAFAALIFLLGSGPGRVTAAALVVSIFVAMGALYVGYIVGILRIAHGVAKWKVNSLLVCLTSMPAVFLYISPLWGPALFAVGFPVILYFCIVDDHAEEQAS